MYVQGQNIRKQVVKAVASKLSREESLISKVYNFQINEARNNLKIHDSIEFTGFFKIVTREKRKTNESKS